MTQENKKLTILVIEDEKDIIMGLKDALEFEGYLVTSAETGEQGISKAAHIHPDLIILDLMLPGINGYEVCEQIRRRDMTVPILILSARSQESDIIRGLEAGADDYVTKPFSIGELLARVRTVFRRISALSTRSSSKITVGDAQIDVQNHCALARGKKIQLGFYETALIQFLDEKRGEVVTRDEILDKIWGINANPTNRTIDNFVLKLRRKLEVNPGSPKHIITVYGYGYKLV
jgi:DNA-binding response OmpR family regulator